MFLNRTASSSHHTTLNQTIPMWYTNERIWFFHVWHWKKHRSSVMWIEDGKRELVCAVLIREVVF